MRPRLYSRLTSVMYIKLLRGLLIELAYRHNSLIASALATCTPTFTLIPNPIGEGEKARRSMHANNEAPSAGAYSQYVINNTLNISRNFNI